MCVGLSVDVWESVRVYVCVGVCVYARACVCECARFYRFILWVHHRRPQLVWVYGVVDVDVVVQAYNRHWILEKK
jgi:hypothetical protein